MRDRGGVGDDDIPDNDGEVPDNISINNSLLFAPLGGAYVGIGTDAPNYELDVVGAVNSDQNYKIGGSTILSIAGSDNTIVGESAGAVNTGSENTFMGRRAGDANTTGSLNTFVGANAGHGITDGSRNVFVGSNTGTADSSSSYNIFIGASAGSNNTTGSQNVYIGDQAGLANTSGNNNVYIGDDQQGIDGESGILRIDNSPDSPPFILGDFSAEILEIKATVEITGDLTVTGTVNGEAIPSAKASGSALSDERLKRNIESIDGKDALAKLAQLRGVRYEWAFPETFDSEPHVGFVAQELENVFPDWVEGVVAPSEVSDAIPEGEKAKGIHFPHDFNAYLVEAIKELKTQNELLRSRIDVLESRLDSNLLSEDKPTN